MPRLAWHNLHKAEARRGRPHPRLRLWVQRQIYSKTPAVLAGARRGCEASCDLTVDMQRPRFGIVAAQPYAVDLLGFALRSALRWRADFYATGPR